MRNITDANSPIQGQSNGRNRRRQRVVLALSAALAVSGCGHAGNKQLGMVGYVGGFAGAVAGDDPRAVLIGQDILTSGGNAVDAVAAMYFAMAVTHPAAVSLGGGGACLLYTKSGRKDTVEALEFLPVTSTEPAVAGGRPSSVPTGVRGVAAMHGKYGKLRWEQVVVPAEQLARLGTPAPRALVTELVRVAEPLTKDAAARKVFAGKDTVVLKEGEPLVQPDLGATLSRIRQKGAGEMYVGQLARDMVAATQAAGGTLSMEDLRGYVPRWVTPIQVKVGDDLAYFVPPPATAGGVAAEMWALLGTESFYKGDAGAKAHGLVEAEGRAFRDRAQWLQHGGSSAVEPTDLVTPAHVKGLAAGFTPERHTAAEDGPAPIDAVVAASVAVVDSSGQAVTCNFTLYNMFGTGRIAAGTGVLLAAAPKPEGKGPYGIGPMLVANPNSRELRFAGAASGGPAAPTALVQVAAQTLLDGKPLAEAEAAKRVHHGGFPDVAYIEDDHPLADALSARGHEVQVVELPGRVEAVACSSGDASAKTCRAATDPRGFGLAVLATGRN